MQATTDAATTAPQAPASDEPETLDFSNRLSDGQANTLYRVAYRLSEQGRHEQASTLLALLCLYRPEEPKYARAGAICFRKVGRYEDAIRMFAKTMELRPDDFEPVFPLVECLLLLKRREQALDLLAKVATVARETGQPGPLERALTLIQLLESPAQ